MSEAETVNAPTLDLRMTFTRDDCGPFLGFISQDGLDLCDVQRVVVDPDGPDATVAVTMTFGGGAFGGGDPAANAARFLTEWYKSDDVDADLARFRVMPGEPPLPPAEEADRRLANG